MIVYITGASGSGKTTLLKSLSVKGYDLDDIYENNWKKHKRIDTVQKGVIKDVNALVSEHKILYLLDFRERIIYHSHLM